MNTRSIFLFAFATVLFFQTNVSGALCAQSESAPSYDQDIYMILDTRLIQKKEAKALRTEENNLRKLVLLQEAYKKNTLTAEEVEIIEQYIKADLLHDPKNIAPLIKELLENNSTSDGKVKN